MANYNEQKIFSELSKLDTDELYMAFGRIKEFVQKQLEASQKEAEEIASTLQSKIDRLNGNN